MYKIEFTLTEVSYLRWDANTDAIYRDMQCANVDSVEIEFSLEYLKKTHIAMYGFYEDSGYEDLKRLAILTKIISCLAINRVSMENIYAINILDDAIIHEFESWEQAINYVTEFYDNDFWDVATGDFGQEFFICEA